MKISYKGIKPFKDFHDYTSRMYVIYDFLVTRDLPSVVGIKSALPLKARVEIVYDTGDGPDHGKERKIVEGLEKELFDEIYSNSYLESYEQSIFSARWMDARYKNLYSKTKDKEILPISVVSNPNELLQRALARANKSAKEVSPKDYSTLYQVLKGKRDLTRDKAINVAEELGIDPVDLMFEKIKIPIWGLATEITNPDRILVSEFNEKPMIVCPRDIHTPLTRAIKFEDDNSMYHNHILFYDFTNEVNDTALNKICVVGFTDYYKDWDDKIESYIRYEIGLYQMYGKEKVLKIIEAGKDQIIRKGFKPHFVAPLKAMVNADALEYSEKLNTKAVQDVGRIIRANEILSGKDDQAITIPKILQRQELQKWREKNKKISEVFSFKEFYKEKSAKEKAEWQKILKQVKISELERTMREKELKEVLSKINDLNGQIKKGANRRVVKEIDDLVIKDSKKRA